MQLSEQRSAYRLRAGERLDYDDPGLMESREQLARFRIDAQISRIQREITGYIRNGGQPPTEQQRDDDDERRGWAMIEQILRGH